MPPDRINWKASSDAVIMSPKYCKKKPLFVRSRYHKATLEEQHTAGLSGTPNAWDWKHKRIHKETIL